MDTESFRPGVTARLGLREELGISADSVVAGCVAHLVPVKGHPTLIEAVARVPEFDLVIAGKPLDREYADSLVNRRAPSAYRTVSTSLVGSGTCQDS